MNLAAVAAMYRRRGQIVQWMHAVPAPAASVDPYYRAPQTPLGGSPSPGVGLGNFGESFLAPVAVWAYYSKKSTSFTQEGYGVLDVGDAQLDFAKNLLPIAGSAIGPTTSPSLDDYQSGRFASFQSDTPIAFDRFLVQGDLWVAKAAAVPIVDTGVVVAWRLAISRASL